ncbi:MAG: hypothetical protein U0166_10525 [Acidobacteriota bacterium]
MSPTIRWIIRIIGIAMLLFFAWTFVWMTGELQRQNAARHAQPTPEEAATAAPAPPPRATP